MNIFQTTAIQQYNYTVEQMEQDRIDEILSEARVYNEQFKNTIVVDPFSQEAENNKSSEYNEILNIDGTMGYLAANHVLVELPSRLISAQIGTQCLIELYRAPF